MAETFSPFGGAILMCIDMQPSFLDAIPDGKRVLQRCCFAVQAARGLGLKVVFTEQVPQKLGGTHPDLLAVAPKPVLFSKNTFSALGDDGIRDALRGLDAEHLILCGVESSICVYQTALDALDINLQVTILTDAVGSRRSEDGKVCLDALSRMNVYVLPSETVFYALLQDASHPFFKGFTQLVKKYA